MKKSDMIIKINEMLEYNTQINKCFRPLVEEFCIRIGEQYNLNEKQFEEKLELFKRLTISFDENLKYLSGHYKENMEYLKDKDCFYLPNQEICFNTFLLKYLYTRKEEYIKELIITSFHELGHNVQRHVNKDIWDTGISRNNKYISEDNSIRISTQGEILNEIANTITANRLFNGNIKQDNYQGYSNTINTGIGIIRSLGMNEDIISQILMKGNGREDYLNYIRSELGDNYLDYVLEIEDDLDILYGLTFQYEVENDENNKNQIREKIANHYYEIIEDSNRIIEQRIKIAEKKNLSKDYAKIIFDKYKRDNEFRIAKEKNHELFPNDFEIDSKMEIQEINDLIEKLGGEKVNKAIEILENQEKENEKNNIQYNNHQFYERVYNSVSKYNLNRFSQETRAKLLSYKNNQDEIEAER